MKAITYSEYGSPDVLELTDQPMPKVGPGMVLVRVRAASVNPENHLLSIRRAGRRCAHQVWHVDEGLRVLD